MRSKTVTWQWVMAPLLVWAFGLELSNYCRAALLAYEPFTNTSGAAIIGNGSGAGFNGVWQSNGSTGTATNMSYGLTYRDAAGNTLASAGGAGFFRGGTAGTSGNSMQPIRRFDFSRGTNGIDGGTTWISFLIARQGPTGTLAGNFYGRGANVPHDLDAGAIQKLAIGNGSGAASNTVALIPQGSAALLAGATNNFGGVTNFVVIRIDHVSGGNDNAYLFVNPSLQSTPLTSAANAVSLGQYDYSFDRLRVFAGGQSSAAQPYAELILDEYRLGENFADVAPIVSNAPPVQTGSLAITNSFMSSGSVVLLGGGGTNGAPYLVLATTNCATPLGNWIPVATNQFDLSGNFSATNPIQPGTSQQYFRLLYSMQPSFVPEAPFMTLQPIDQTTLLGQSVTFTAAAGGTAPLNYQWYFNTNTILPNATNPTLILAGVQTNQAGVYSVRVTNNVGAVTSAIARLTVNVPPGLLPGAYFVAPTGSDANPGTIASPFLTIAKGLNTITTSGTVYLRGGTYAQPGKLSLSRTGVTNGAIRLWAYPGETPVVNSSGNTSDGISLSGRGYHLKGITVMLAGHNGINISGNSNVVENCVTVSNGNTGLHLTGSAAPGPTANLILNCDSYLNFDVPATGETGGNADGFSAKWDIGPGNVFRGCRAWWNSDDGWDLWMGTNPVLIDQCWAFYNGTNYWNDPRFNGNGQGFKLGGNYIGTPHRLLRSVAFRNEANGVDQNNNEEGQTIDNNTCWANKARNFNLNHGTNSNPHIVRNNLSFAGTSADTFRSGTLFTNNSWQLITAPSAGASDVLSVDESVARASRNADGTLPYWPFLRPVPTGRLIDKGVILTEPYTGTAPELGAFEDGL